jgi:ABC-type cobalamin/Fe3+-siderophores transport system ATPase subunit
VILLRAGHVMADGPKKAVLTEANLRELFGVKVKLQKQDGFFHIY